MKLSMNGWKMCHPETIDQNTLAEIIKDLDELFEEEEKADGDINRTRDK